MKIFIQDLTPEIKSKLPLSLQIQKEAIDVERLPISIQYLIYNQDIPEIVETYTETNFYDVTFDISEYQDLKTKKTKKEIVL